MDLNYNVQTNVGANGQFNAVPSNNFVTGTNVWGEGYTPSQQLQLLNSQLDGMTLSNTGTNYLDQMMTISHRNSLPTTIPAPQGQFFVTPVALNQGNNSNVPITPSNLTGYIPGGGSLPPSPATMPDSFHFPNRFLTPAEINMLTPEQQLALVAELQAKIVATGSTPVTTPEFSPTQTNSPRTPDRKAFSLPRGVGNLSSYKFDSSDVSSNSSTSDMAQYCIVRSVGSTPENTRKKRMSFNSETSSTSSASIPSSPVSGGKPSFTQYEEDSDTRIKLATPTSYPAPPMSPPSYSTANKKVHKPIKSNSLKIQVKYPQDKCYKCGKKVYGMEKITASRGAVFHKNCFKCETCGTKLTLKTYFHNENDPYNASVYCKAHQPKIVDKGGKIDSNSFLIKGAMSVPRLDMHNEQVRGVGKSHMDQFSKDIVHAQKVPVTNLQMGNKYKLATWSKKGRKKLETKSLADVKYGDPVADYDQSEEYTVPYTDQNDTF